MSPVGEKRQRTGENIPMEESNPDSIPRPIGPEPAPSKAVHPVVDLTELLNKKSGPIGNILQDDRVKFDDSDINRSKIARNLLTQEHIKFLYSIPKTPMFSPKQLPQFPNRRARVEGIRAVLPKGSPQAIPTGAIITNVGRMLELLKNPCIIP